MKNQIKIRLQELATDNFNTYSEDYPLEKGLSTDEATIQAQELAISYYEHREDNEITRDEELEITKTDYVDWIMEAFSNYIQNL